MKKALAVICVTFALAVATGFPPPDSPPGVIAGFPPPDIPPGLIAGFPPPDIPPSALV